MRKHNWNRYNPTRKGKNNPGTMCEIKIMDEDDKRLDFFKFSISDKNSQRTIGNILKFSYGISFQKTNKDEENREVQRIIKEDLGL